MLLFKTLSLTNAGSNSTTIHWCFFGLGQILASIDLLYNKTTLNESFNDILSNSLIIASLLDYLSPRNSRTFYILSSNVYAICSHRRVCICLCILFFISMYAMFGWVYGCTFHDILQKLIIKFMTNQQSYLRINEFS